MVINVFCLLYPWEYTKNWALAETKLVKGRIRPKIPKFWTHDDVFKKLGCMAMLCGKFRDQRCIFIKKITKKGKIVILAHLISSFYRYALLYTVDKLFFQNFRPKKSHVIRKKIPLDSLKKSCDLLFLKNHNWFVKLSKSLFLSFILLCHRFLRVDVFYDCWNELLKSLY